MGKQSARMVYQGKDHKDIYYQGHYHKQMYKGRLLVWEKIEETFRFNVSSSIIKAASFLVRGEVVIDFGDGNHKTIRSSSSLARIVHSYEEEGIYTIIITGNLKNISFNTNSNNLIEVLDKFPKSMKECKSFQECFLNCEYLRSIPTGLFDNCPDVLNFYRCFYGNRRLESIPTGLFDNCTNVLRFDGCFYNCRNINLIPEKLFEKCHNVEIFNDCFRLNTNLKEIPSKLFKNCTNVTGFAGCFSNCISLTAIPIGLFSDCNKVENFKQCFQSCTNVESELPALWKRDNVIHYDDCFYQCTKAINFSDVPYDWR